MPSHLFQKGQFKDFKYVTDATANRLNDRFYAYNASQNRFN